MSKLKVGDRVRVKESNNFIMAGTIGIITNIDSDGDFWIRCLKGTFKENDDNIWCYGKKRKLVKLVPPKKNNKPTNHELRKIQNKIYLAMDLLKEADLDLLRHLPPEGLKRSEG